MYAWLWRKLPGPWPAKLVWTVAGLAAIIAVLFLWVFPWLEPQLPFNDVTVDETSEVAVSETPAPGITGPDGTVIEITEAPTGPTVTPSVVGSPAPSPS